MHNLRETWLMRSVGRVALVLCQLLAHTHTHTHAQLHSTLHTPHKPCSRSACFCGIQTHHTPPPPRTHTTTTLLFIFRSLSSLSQQYKDISKWKWKDFEDEIKDKKAIVTTGMTGNNTHRSRAHVRINTLLID